MTVTTALNVPELLDAASAKTGLSDYGDDWFREPLDVLVTALNTEAVLSPLGHELTKRRLTALLSDRLRLRALQREHPSVLDVEVRVAAEICGLPRTGSTLLHRLLAASPQVTSTLSWEVAYPIPFPGEGPGAPERKRRAQERMQLMSQLPSNFGDLHTVVWDGPEEDVILLDRTFVSMSFDSFYWVPSYGDWLRTVDQGPAYRELREWLQVLQWQSPSRSLPWVLKSPHHLTAVDTVLDEFADCKIVMTHRSPVNAVPSYASMVSAISAQYSADVDPVRIGRYWSRRFAKTLAGFASARAARPDRFVDVRFADTVAKPVEVAREVLDALGLPAGPADDAAFETYLEQNRTERHGSHSYAPPDFGLSEDQLRRDFAFYSEVYL
ncbi:sulfotransferase family protein [Lentzea aerocolonigenes]|uniref:sulfotransferase family protein n=1 Tax=Lentzea aerocolonigenes TaxID=68170 RepID=UPI0004C3E159|nr:sulfotransferase [Lentzea aerocolonigenes]MCP2246495.1 Sulfotransferase family protein [Lentzea aerocolonigenes]